MTADDEVARSYAEELEELTFNSKPIINSLTMIAEELNESCAAIVGVIEKKIREAANDKKLPPLYLLDSISKNVGGVYVQQFAKNLPSLVGSVYDVSGPKVRNSLHALINTWKGVFPDDVVGQVSARMSSTARGAFANCSTAPQASLPNQLKPSEPQPVMVQLSAQPQPAIEQLCAHSQPAIVPLSAEPQVGRMGVLAQQRKRARERTSIPSASVTALHAELKGLMAQLRMYVHSGSVQQRSPHQWATMTTQARGLCAQLISLMPENSHETRALDQEISQMQ
ncbi:MAG: hypothetical protein SGPRY_009428, partial [Prymnesium sp.]